jgi:hypothetical protein
MSASRLFFSFNLIFPFSTCSRAADFSLQHFQTADQNGMMGTMMQDLAFAIPGVDEAMSFAEIMKYVTTTLCAHMVVYRWCPKKNGQARQVHGILCNCIRHGANRPHATVPLFSERPRKGAGEAVDAEWAYRAHDKSGMLKSFRFRALGRRHHIVLFHADVYAYGWSGGRDRRYVLKA